MFSCYIVQIVSGEILNTQTCKTQQGWIFECDIVLHYIDILGWLIATLGIVYFGTQIAVKSYNSFWVSDKDAS